MVGATHGNELTGAWVAKRVESEPELAARPSFESVQTLIGNPRAYAATARFVDADLNRQFSTEALQDLSRPGYEAARARELDALFGPKAAPAAASGRPGGSADFLVDLHTTTSEMGVTFIAEPWSPLGVAAACWCQRELRPRAAAGELPEVRVVLESLDRRASPHLISAARDGLMIEVGPVPQGLLLARACGWMEAAAAAVMDFLEKFNAGARLDLPEKMVVYRDVGVKVPVPTGADGKPEAVFHADFQGGDFKPLRKGDPMFQRVSGEVITYDGAHGEEIWPLFINEAAYYLPESGLGFGVSLREEAEVPQVICSSSSVAGSAP